MNPMRIGGGNQADGAVLHNSYTSVSGRLVPSTAPIYKPHPTDYVPNNPHMPSQQPRLPYLNQVRAQLARTMTGVRG